MVALRKESVDRKVDNWTWSGGMWVALRKESVDRKVDTALYDVQSGVALRKESVDRKRILTCNIPLQRGRSPQGERG